MQTIDNTAALDPSLRIDRVQGTNLNEDLGVNAVRQKEITRELDALKQKLYPGKDFPSKIAIAEMVSRVVKTPGELYFMAYTMGSIFENSTFSASPGWSMKDGDNHINV